MNSENTTTQIREVTPIDELELIMINGPQIVCPLVHSFCPGIYIRQIHMPAGSLISSMEHDTEHFFIVVSGTVDVMSKDGTQSFSGPFMGVTMPGTKRLLYTHTDTIWITVHANPDNITDPDEIVRRITVPNSNPLIDDPDAPEFNKWRTTVSPSVFLINGIIQPEKIS